MKALVNCNDHCNEVTQFREGDKGAPTAGEDPKLNCQANLSDLNESKGRKFILDN